MRLKLIEFLSLLSCDPTLMFIRINLYYSREQYEIRESFKIKFHNFSLGKAYHNERTGEIENLSIKVCIYRIKDKSLFLCSCPERYNYNPLPSNKFKYDLTPRQIGYTFHPSEDPIIAGGK